MAEEPIRCWLVERDYWDEDVLTLVYATPDGTRYYQRQLSAGLLGSIEITAATEVPPSELEPTSEADCERYRTEATRVRNTHDPDETV